MNFTPIPLSLERSQSDNIYSLKCMGKLPLASFKLEFGSNYYLNFP